ncbi:MAG: hypothetical protein QOJ68_43 [Blastococcus sp.]|nr:hypothetical protein [Blastococcus sp.]
MQPDPPPFPHPDEAPGTWDPLAFGAAEAPPPWRRKLVAGVVAAGVLVLAGLGLGEFLPGDAGPEPRIITLTPHPAPPSTYLSMDGSTRPLIPFHTIPAPTLAPAGLGDDPTFNLFARECSGGSMHVCDELYAVSAAGSRYEAYADTCAGRQPRDTNRYCTVSFPGS